MYLIIINNESKYWTNSYDEIDGRVKFETKSKAGRVATHDLRKDTIQEIIDMGEVGNETSIDDIRDMEEPKAKGRPKKFDKSVKKDND